MYLRRDALLLTVGALAALLLTPSRGNPQSHTLNITLTISAPTPFTLPPEAQFEGDIHSTQSKGFPLIITVAIGVVVASYLTELIAQVWDWATNGTVIIDLRGRGINIYNKPFSTSKFIIITDSDVKVFSRNDVTKDVLETFVKTALAAKG